MKTCKQCGHQLPPATPNAVYCRVCREQRRKESIKKAVEKHRADLVDKPCLDCGAMLHQVTTGTRYCKKCQIARRKAGMKRKQPKPHKAVKPNGEIDPYYLRRGEPGYLGASSISM